jgi:hypothetical protein
MVLCSTKRDPDSVDFPGAQVIENGELISDKVSRLFVERELTCNSC